MIKCGLGYFLAAIGLFFHKTLGHPASVFSHSSPSVCFYFKYACLGLAFFSGLFQDLRCTCDYITRYLLKLFEGLCM
jgi:hypothetical protein